MDRLDTHSQLPPAMGKYLSVHGWHFSKALCEFACKKMKDRNESKHQMIEKSKVEEYMKAAGVQLKNDVLYDSTFVYNMAMSDYYGSSLKDNTSVAMFVHDYLDDVDGTKTRAMDEYIGKCIGAGCPIPWDDML